MDIHLFLIVTHVLGTILGVGGATFIETHLNLALKDGKMDATERTFLGTDFFLTRIGMVVCLVTGIGFVVEYYYFDQLFRLGGVFWSKMLIFVIIAFNAYLLHKHKIGIYWGSALSFVSWWAAMLLGIFTTNSHTIFPENLFLSMTAILSVYILIVIIGAFILHKFRSMGKLTPIV